VRRWQAVLFVVALGFVVPRAARAQCDEHGLTVGLTTGIGVAAGATGALVVAGALAEGDDTRDFDFGVGAGVGIGVTAGLAGIYLAVDLLTNCQMAAESGGAVIWSVPIVLFVVGAALPAAVWGASDEVAPEGTTGAALSATPMTIRF
jgi:hypothetical protein